ncbi:universal stress protein [Nocardia rhizosphaerihabitans]|uniref:universal stress protein n=1 Tax=Nocardia rhizosphaerihabitans TaxID=1691570 RepID=UPI00366BD2C9
MPARHASPVVVGVDGSDAALTAVRWAANTAALRQAPLHLVHATSSGWDLGERVGVVALHSRRFHDEGDAGLATAECVRRTGDYSGEWCRPPQHGAALFAHTVLRSSILSDLSPARLAPEFLAGGAWRCGIRQEPSG